MLSKKDMDLLLKKGAGKKAKQLLNQISEAEEVLSRITFVFAGLVFDEYIKSLGAAGMNNILAAKVSLQKMKQIAQAIADGKNAKTLVERIAVQDREFEKYRSILLQILPIARAYYKLRLYTSNPAIAVRRALVFKWEGQKDNLQENGITDKELLAIASETLGIGSEPSKIWEKKLDEISKKYGLVLPGS